MNFTLEENEVAFILNVLGNLPTQTGAFPLLVKIQTQAQGQAPAPVEAPVDQPTEEAAPATEITQ